MDYYRAIQQVYPNAVFELRDIGKGVFINKWEDTKPQPDLKDLQELALKLSEAKQKELDLEEKYNLLMKTDWYALRSIEDPLQPVPAEIKTSRQQARDDISLVKTELGVLSTDIADTIDVIKATPKTVGVVNGVG